MKILLTSVGLFAVVGCSPFPRTDIRVADGNGVPISGLPLRLEFSDGLSRHTPPNSFDSVGAAKLELRTDEEGKAKVEYTFTKKQPSDLRSVLLGAKRVPNQWIKITPMQAVPKGSTITIGIPNP